MFADVSGFTAMSRRMDPEDVTDVMNRCFAQLEEAVTSRGGWVDKYVGDCVLAVFDGGGSECTLRAVEAAIDIRDRIATFSEQAALAHRLEIHVGIEAGTVLLRRTGDGDTVAVMGDTVTTADRLKDAAPLRAIWVGPAAYEAARDAFPFRPVQPTAAKGGPGIARAWELALDDAPARDDTGAPPGAADPDGAERDGDRRQTTVVFAEVTGLTALAADAEAVGRLLAAIETTVREHGGHLDKYVGDCVMALFGAPRAIEDAPRQALNAAIALRRLVSEFVAHAHGPPLAVRIGVNSGLVLAGEVGGARHHDFTVMGDTVNLASRIKDATPAGAIWLGPATWAETRRDFEFHAMPPVRFKGFERPVGVRELRSEQVRRHRGRPTVGERTLLTRMVGRDAELSAIRERLAAVVESGSGAIVSIVAEAGLGKSRLLAETTRLSEAAHVTLLEGRSLSMGARLSFHPFADALRQWLALTEDVEEEAARARLGRALEELLGDAGAEAFPFVATVMGLRVIGPDAERLRAIEGEALERLLAKTLRDLLAAGAARRPLVLAFEDLHWADLSSIRLLQALLPLVRKHPIVFVHVFRPNHAETSDRVLADIRARWADRHLELRLGPLGDGDCARLLRQLVQIDERPTTTRRVVLARAEGNPFFIEETVRALIDLGAIERTPEGLRVTDRIEHVEVPSTIQGVVMSRVDRLGESDRRLLQVGAVIGRTFSTRLLRAVMEAPPDLDTSLARLRKRQLIERGRAGDEPGWAFTHALAQETVYETILRRTRRTLHGRVARTVETLFAERLPEYYGMLAYHYGRARDLEKAGEYLMKAGDEAARSAASHEAVHYFSEAARIYVELHGETGDAATRAVLEKKIGLAYLAKGDLQNALDHFDAALAHLGVRPPRAPLAVARRLALDLGAIVYHVYRPLSRRRRAPRRETIEMAEICFHKGKAQSTSAPQGYVLSMLPAIRVIGAWDPTPVRDACGVYSCGATLFAWSGLSFALARRMLWHAEGFVRSMPDRVVHQCMRFLTDYLEGDWRDERVPDEAVVREGLRYGMFWEVNTYLGFDCERLIRQGRFARALACLDRIAEIGDVYGYDFARTNEYAMRAFLLCEAGRFPNALAAVDRYHAICTEDALNILALGTRARILLGAGDRPAAEAALEEGEEIARRLGRQAAPYHLAPIVVSRFLFDVGTLEQETNGAPPPRPLARRAAASGRRAVALVARNAGERVEAYRAMGRLAWLRGQPRRAERWWHRALAEGGRLDARPAVARLLCEIGTRAADGRGAALAIDGMPAPALLEDGRRRMAALEREWADCLDGGGAARQSA